MKTRIELKSFDALSFAVLTGATQTGGRDASSARVEARRFAAVHDQRIHPGERRVLEGLLPKAPTIDSPLNDV